MLDEINPVAVIISLIGSAIFLGFMWKSNIWANVGIKSKIGISILMPPVLYFVVVKMLNK